MAQLSIITVYKDPGSDLTKTEDSVLREFGSSRDIEYIQKEWSPEPELTESNKNIDGKLPCRHIRGRDSGVFDGMLQALGYATGEWVLFLNAGDWLAEGFAKRFEEALEGTDDCAFLYFDGMTVDCLDGRTFPRQAPERLRLQDFYHRNPVLHPCLVVRRSVMEDYGYDLDLNLAADFDLVVRMVSNRVPSKHIPFVGAYVLSGGLSEKCRMRAKWQAMHSLLRSRDSSWDAVRIVVSFFRFLVLHACIKVIHRLPFFRRWLHRRTP